MPNDGSEESENPKVRTLKEKYRPTRSNKSLQRIEGKDEVTPLRPEDPPYIRGSRITTSRFKDIDSLTLRDENRKADRTQKIASYNDEDTGKTNHGLYRVSR